MNDENKRGLVAPSTENPVQVPLEYHDLGGSLAAIKRAAQRARKIADQTGTDLIVVRAGQLVRIAPRTEA